MAAPNGARLTTADHPAVPVTIEATIETALSCKQAGAHALHAHVRDEQQRHTLDMAKYQLLLDAAKAKLGLTFPVQITTEALGIFSAKEQIDLVKSLKPDYASVALKELTRAPERDVAAFYHWCYNNRIGLQHILYSLEDLNAFNTLRERDIIPAANKAVIMVAGRYTETVTADPEAAKALIKQVAAQDLYWMLCAFGKTETECLQAAAKADGAVRVGFENSVLHSDGTVANNNVDRVQAVISAISDTTTARENVLQDTQTEPQKNAVPDAHRIKQYLGYCFD